MLPSQIKRKSRWSWIWGRPPQQNIDDISDTPPKAVDDNKTIKNIKK